MPDLFPVGQPNAAPDNFEDKTKNLSLAGDHNEFLDNEAIGGGPKSEFLRPAISERRRAAILILFLLALGFLAARSGYLQIAKGAYYRNAAEENRIHTEIIPAWRGIIYDRNGLPLVKNIPTYQISIIPNDIFKNAEKRKEFLEKLGAILEISAAELENKLTESENPKNQPVPIKENLEHDRAIALLVQSSGFNNVNLEIGSRREYLVGGGSLSHVLGYLGKINKEEYENLKDEGYYFRDFIGKTGIENVYEKILRGEYGRKQTEVDAMGREKNIIAKEDPKNGENITLTIDFEMQKKLEEIIQSYISRLGKKKAAGIIQNPQNGEILAMVNLPFFDNNEFSAGIDAERYMALSADKNMPFLNRAISGEYPPGSTIKPIIATAALEEKIINENTSFLSTGGIRIGQWFFPDWKAGGHGITNTRKAIAESINTFFYYVGGGYGNFSGLGVVRIAKYLSMFCIGERLGIDLNGETTGFVPSEEWKEQIKDEDWYIGDTYHLSIGQGDVLVTPLQVASYTSFFANGGTIWKPHLLKNAPVEIIKNDMISKETIEIIRQGMRQTVTAGSARPLNDLPVAVAGKTGTAQWQNGKSAHAWFTGFAPYNNPEITITILVEEGGEGSSVSVPIARDFLKWYYGKTRN